MTSPTFLGIDIAKRSFAAALIAPEARTRHQSFDNTRAGFDQLAAWLRHHATGHVHAALEATGTYGDALALFLHQTGVRVSVVNPARIHAFAQSELARTKTDKTDAAVIARFVSTQHPPAWTPPPPERRQLQALVRRVEALQAMRQAEANRLELASADSLVAPSLREHLAHVDAQLGQLRRLITIHLHDHPSLQQQHDLLVSIPGIGALTAIKLLAELPSVDTLPTARQAAAHAGLTPRHRQSGTSVRGRSRIAKTGNARLRHALYMPAIVAMRANPLLRQFAERLRAAGKAPRQIICAVMRKLLHQAYGVLKHATPFNPNHTPTH
jgi:transposase